MSPRTTETRHGHRRILGALGSRFGRRVVALFVASAVVPLATIAIFTMTKTSEQLLDQAHRRLHGSAKSLGMTVVERLKVVESDVGQLVVGLETDPDYLESKAVRTRISPRVADVRLIDRRDPASTERRTGLPTIDAAGLRHLKSHTSFIRVRQSNEDRGGSADVFLVARAPGADEFLVARVAPEYLWAGDSFSPMETEVLVYGPRRELLFCSSRDVPSEALDAALVNSPRAGRFEWQSGSTDYVGAYWKLFAKHDFDTSWVFAHSQPRADVLGTLLGFRRFFLLSIALGATTVILLSLVQVRRTLGPITQLEAATRRVADGDFSAQIDIRSGDEFEDLADRFNHMLERLTANIEKRERVERELVTARDKAIDAAKKEVAFVQNVSHELRTPMTSIRSFAEILSNYDEDAETRAEFLQIILTESDRLTRLIDQILDFSTVHGDGSEWAFEDVVVEDVAEDTARALGPFAADHSVAISFVRPETSTGLSADRDRLQQVITNLLSNAIKFSEPGSEVAVRVFCEDEHAFIEVQDWGCGIDADDKRQVFERFRQVTSDTLTNKPPGTGLGLAITHEIVEHHGGRIDVESEPGVGSTFRVVIPGAHVLEGTPVSTPADA